MPTLADSPLRKVTLNLYEADCILLEQKLGHGWSEWVRSTIHFNVRQMQQADAGRRATLGDLNGQ